MLQPHSFLWHYLWLAPHVLQCVLAAFLWRGGLHRKFPVFFAYLVFTTAKEFTLYAMDIIPSVSSDSFWLAYFIGMVVEESLKLAVIGELFFHLLRSRSAIAKVGRHMISGTGAALVLLATLAAAHTQVGHAPVALAHLSHVLLQSSYIVEAGLALFLFSFAAYYGIAWDHRALGIALGFGVAWCEHLGVFALIASGTLLDKRLDFLNMATYHVCVLVWFYFLLVPEKVATTSAVSLPENNLDIWNRELERLLQQ
jgi:hypothetical protein